MPRTRSVNSIITVTGDLAFTYKKRNPADGEYFDNTEILGCSVRVVNTEDGTELLTTTNMTYDADIGGYRYVWGYGVALDTVDTITVIMVPNRDPSVAPALAPTDRDEYDVASLTGSGSTNINFDAGAVFDDMLLLVPDPIIIPETGNPAVTYKMWFFLRNDEGTPPEPIDPDGDSVTINVEDQSGNPPVGLTLANAGVMTKEGVGEYSLELTVDDSLTSLQYIFFRELHTLAGRPGKTAVLRFSTALSNIVDLTIEEGDIWYSDTGAPLSTLGDTGDHYLDTDTGDIYEKTDAATWTLEGNLTGPQGIQGIQGPAGDPASITVQNVSGSITIPEVNTLVIDDNDGYILNDIGGGSARLDLVNYLTETEADAIYSQLGHTHSHSSLTGIGPDDHHDPVTLGGASHPSLELVGQEITLNENAFNAAISLTVRLCDDTEVIIGIDDLCFDASRFGIEDLGGGQVKITDPGTPGAVVTP